MIEAVLISSGLGLAGGSLLGLLLYLAQRSLRQAEATAADLTAQLVEARRAEAAEHERAERFQLIAKQATTKGTSEYDSKWLTHMFRVVEASDLAAAQQLADQYASGLLPQEFPDAGDPGAERGGRTAGSRVPIATELP